MYAGTPKVSQASILKDRLFGFLGLTECRALSMQKACYGAQEAANKAWELC